MDERAIKEKLVYASVFKHTCSEINDYFNSIKAVGDLPSKEMIEKGMNCVKSTKDGVNTKCADAFDALMKCEKEGCFAPKQALIACAIENKIGDLE